MKWFTVDLKDPKTGERFTTQEKDVSQYGAEMGAALRLLEEGETLEVLPKHEQKQ